jgi:hypothetical protein
MSPCSFEEKRLAGNVIQVYDERKGMGVAAE